MTLADLNPVLAATLIQRRQVARKVARSPRFVEQIDKLARQLQLPTAQVAAEAFRERRRIAHYQRARGKRSE